MNKKSKETNTGISCLKLCVFQMLEIHSSSLVSLTLRQVGVTDLVISECPKLQMLAGKICIFI